MNLKLSLVLFLISFSLTAQKKEVSDTLTIKMTPVISSRVVLYAAEGATQKYSSYADSDDGVFKLAIPKGSAKGMYRLVFNQKTMDYIDLLFLNQSFEIHFDPTKPDQNPVFINSNSNKDYFSKGAIIAKKQQKLDSLQVVYFQENEAKELKKIRKRYQETKAQLDNYLAAFYRAEKNSIVKDLIKANTRIQPKEPIKNPEEYLPFIKKHYFDTIDFNNPNLIYSSILIDKVMDFVFYLTVSNDVETQNKLYKEAVQDVLQRIDNPKLKTGFIEALIQSFARDENIILTDYLFTHFYDKLATSYQKKDFKQSILKELRTAVGRIAGEITWEENKKTMRLSDLKDHEYYILVFWSSSCPHCLKELPKLHEFTKDKKNIKVIAIGLETKESRGSWKSETYYYPEFTHIVGLGKWESPIARTYNVYSTPNYFVLDATKRIIAKPYEVVDLKVFFNGLK